MKSALTAALLAASVTLSCGWASADDAHRAPRSAKRVKPAVKTPLLISLGNYLELRGQELRGIGDKFRPFSHGSFLDLYPLSGGPRISAGVTEGGSRIGLRAICPSACGLDTYETSDGSSARQGDRRYKKVVPYLGLGYGDALAGLPFSFSLDAGVLVWGQQHHNFPGNPGADFGYNQSDTLNLDDFDLLAGNFKYNPVVQFSLGWRF